jgi:CheY-like chemotaxis protein
LYSEIGQGTVVKLYLPRLVGDQPDADVVKAAAPIPVGAGETILVVEDEASVREHSSDLLRELGYRVLSAGNGHAALRVLGLEPAVSLLFTDVGLPGGMNGRQLADAARALRPDLKVLYTTGYARNAIAHDGAIDPGTQLLPKPFSYAALAAKVRTVLHG